MPTKPNPNTLSVTRLIDSPLIPFLTTKNWDDLESDLADMLYQMEGSIVHEIMEEHAEPGEQVEENAHLFVGDTMLTMRVDKYNEAEAEITDWKGTSVWAYVAAKKENGTGAKTDWIKQLNVYAWIFRRLGRPVAKLTIWLRFRDWTPSEKARSGPDYPEAPFVKVDIPLWEDDVAFEFVKQRIMAHSSCTEECLYVCSDEERWTRPTTWAVIKKGRKSALAVFGPGTTRGGDEKDAVAFAAKEGASAHVEERRGSHVRCELYCQVRSVCPVLQREAEELMGKSPAASAEESEDMPF